MDDAAVSTNGDSGSDGTSSRVSRNRACNTQEVREGAVTLRSKPLQINIELTGQCNISPPCVFCTGKNVGHSYPPLDTAHIERYADFLDCCQQINDDSFGEPLSHPGLIDLARRITGNGQVFSLVSNGLLLDRRRSAALAACGPRLGLHLSFNAATAETFYQLTGRRFSRLVENTRRFVTSYRELHGTALFNLILTFIVMRINRHEVPDFLQLAAELGAPRVLLASLHDRPMVPLADFGYRFVYEDEMLSFDELTAIGDAALQQAESLGISCLLQWNESHDSAIRGFAEPGAAAPCLIPWRFLFIQEHLQRTIACPYHRHGIGDLRTSSLAEIWNDEPAREMRRSLAAGEIPKLCWDISATCPLILRARHEQGDLLRRPAATHLTVGENDIWQALDGWLPLEHIPEPARWIGPEARFRLRLARSNVVLLRAAVFRDDLRGGTVGVSLQLNGDEVGERRLPVGCWTTLCFPIESGRFGSVAEGKLLVDPPCTPAPAGSGGEMRTLGIAVRKIWSETVEVVDRIVVGENDPWQVLDGWFPPEQTSGTARWTGPEATFRLRLARSNVVLLRAAVFRDDLRGGTVGVSLQLNGDEVGAQHLPTGDCTTLCFPLDPSRCGSIAEGKLHIEPTFVPAASDPDSGDVRELGIAIYEIRSAAIAAASRIEVGDNDLWHLGGGWYSLERIPEPVRTTGKEASFRLCTTGCRRLVVEAAVLRHDLDKHPLGCRVLLHDTEIGSVVIDRPGLHRLSFRVPKRYRQGEWQGMLITDAIWVPPVEAGSPNPRRLGITVRRIYTERAVATLKRYLSHAARLLLLQARRRWHRR